MVYVLFVYPLAISLAFAVLGLPTTAETQGIVAGGSIIWTLVTFSKWHRKLNPKPPPEDAGR